MINKGCAYKQVSKQTKVKYKGVSSFRHRKGLPSREESKNTLLLKFYKQGLNDSQIANKIGIAERTVYKWRNVNNLKSVKQQELQKIHKKILKLHRQKYTPLQISQEVEINIGKVYWHLSLDKN